MVHCIYRAYVGTVQWLVYVCTVCYFMYAIQYVTVCVYNESLWKHSQPIWTLLTQQFTNNDNYSLWWVCHCWEKDYPYCHLCEWVWLSVSVYVWMSECEGMCEWVWGYVWAGVRLSTCAGTQRTVIRSQFSWSHWNLSSTLQYSNYKYILYTLCVINS